MIINKIIFNTDSVQVINETIPAGRGMTTKETALYIDGVRVAAGAGWNCHRILARAKKEVLK